MGMHFVALLCPAWHWRSWGEEGVGSHKPKVSNMHTHILRKFLKEANKATYANKEARKVASSRPKSCDYHFEKGNLIYHDTYFGARDFIGEEIVYENEQPAWGANYFGFILDEKVSEKDVYDFLRRALMYEYDDHIPVRGPTKFSDGAWSYEFTTNGTLENFSGQEQIFLNTNIVYRCIIHGGFIT